MLQMGREGKVLQQLFRQKKLVRFPFTTLHDENTGNSKIKMLFSVHWTMSNMLFNWTTPYFYLPRAFISNSLPLKGVQYTQCLLGAI